MEWPDILLSACRARSTLFFVYRAATHSSRRTICYLSKLWWVCLLTDPLLHEGVSGLFAAFRLFIPEAWNCDYHSGAHPSRSLIHTRTLNIRICILLSLSFSLPLSSCLCLPLSWYTHTHTQKHTQTQKEPPTAASGHLSNNPICFLSHDVSHWHREEKIRFTPPQGPCSCTDMENDFSAAWAHKHYFGLPC